MPQRAIFVLGAFLASMTLVQAQDCVRINPGPCSLLNQARVIFVGTVIEEKKDSDTHKFRVTEAFNGVTSDSIDVSEGISHLNYQLGEEYLVFADPCWWESPDTGCLTSMACSNTRELKYAAALVEQLRAEKSGKRVAAVYGTLVRTVQGHMALGDEYDRPLINVMIRLQSGRRSFETKTGEHGVYAFNRLPPGTWQVSAELPPNLELGDLIRDEPESTFELPRRTCFENNLYALPTGRISGRVIGPDGNPLPTASVELYRASRYKERERGIYGWQGQKRALEEWKPFEFNHLPPDDYILVFNYANTEQPNAPFPRTFYPGATSLANSQRIHLSDGQRISNADIRVSNPLPTRQITVRLDWNGRTPRAYRPPRVIAEASEGMQPYPNENGPDAYILNVLLTARYTIRAQAFCRLGTKGKTETGEVTIDGNDMSISEVTLRFESGGCIPK